MSSQPTATLNTTRTATATATTSGATVKTRQLVRNYPPSLCSSSSSSPFYFCPLTKQSHLQSQLSMLSGHLADTDSLVRVTAAQAAYLRELGSWHAGLFMAASKVLGEDGGKESRQ